MPKFWTLFALLLPGVALAQDALPGVPAEYQPLVTLAVALLTSWLVGPLTAIGKKWWGTTGLSTVAVSAVLSLLIGVGFTAWGALAARGDVPWGAALFAALLGFVRANGEYISRVFANTKALNNAAPQPTAPVTPPVGGLENIHD